MDRIAVAVPGVLGLIWLWLNVDSESLFFKVVIVGVLWAVWMAVVLAALGIVAMFLGAFHKR